MDTPSSQEHGTQKPLPNTTPRETTTVDQDGGTVSNNNTGSDTEANDMSASRAIDTQLDALTLVSTPTKELLNDKELIDYHTGRKRRAKWYLTLGKEPVKVKGYSPTTIKSRITNLDKFFRFSWQHNNDTDNGSENGSGNENGNSSGSGNRSGYQYQTTVSHDDANDYIQELIYKDVTDQYRANVQKSILMYFKYRAYNNGTSMENVDLLWEPDVQFSQHTPTTIQRGHFNKQELRELRSTALSYGSPPHYCALTPEQRDEWKIHLAQRYEIPKDDVGPTTFERADGFKIASLVCTSLDTGLRPIEVGRATTEWFKPSHNALHIPRQDGTKNDEHWNVALRESTTQLISRWVDEREMYEKYDGTDALWLTKYGNPYDSQGLSRLVRKLCEDTSVDADERQPTWYYIRRGVATVMANESNVHEAQMQLRHKSPETTLRYVQSDTDARRHTLENSF